MFSLLENVWGVTSSTIPSCTPIFPSKRHPTTSFVVRERHMCTIGQAIQVLILYQTLKLGVRLSDNYHYKDP